MNSVISYLLLIALFLLATSFKMVNPTMSAHYQPGNSPSLSEEHCTSNFNDEVKTYTLRDDGDRIGHSIWISRKSQKAKAKYFAYEQEGEEVHERYDNWREDKNVFLISSGAYATDFSNSALPTGLTVDNGIVVNRDYQDKMDGLVIIESVGGIRVSNIEDGDLYLRSLSGKVDVKDPLDRVKFLDWAKKEDATVFQTHLLVYKNELKIDKDQSSSKTAKRKFLVLAIDEHGELFHIIFYMKKRSYSLYKGTNMVYQYLNDKDINVVAMINLDTGAYDILHTGEEVRDCNNNYIVGTSNEKREEMTNLLAYIYE